MFTHHRQDDIPVIIALFGLACLFFWPAVVHPNDLIYPPAGWYSDLTVTHWPNAFFVTQTVQQYGQLPLWRPLIMSGAPFAGNPLSGLFYPFNWLFLALPLGPTFNALFILHVFIAGLSMYGLMRRGLATGPFAASVAAVAFMFTPKLVAHLGAGHVGLVYALAWLPLTLLAVVQAINRWSPLRAALAGGLLALQMMADVRIAFYTALLVSLYAAFCVTITAIRSPTGRRWPQAASLALVLTPLPVAFASIGAVQILPTLELMGHTNRGHLTLAEAGAFSLPWRYLLGLLLANHGGFHEWMTYLGLLPLLLAGFALAANVGQDGILPLMLEPAANVRQDGILPHNRQSGAFFGGLALFAALFALGVNAPLFPILYRLLPGLTWLRVPSRLWLLAALGVAVLAGMGAARLSAGRFGERARKRLTLLGLAGIVFAVLLTGGWAALYPPLPANVLGFGVFLSLGLAAITLQLNGALRPPLFKAALLLTLVADLWFADASLLRYVSPEQAFAPGRDVIEYLRAQEGLFRVYSPSYSLPQHLTAEAGLQTVDGVDPSQLARYVEFMRLAGGYEASGYGVTIPPFPDGQTIAQAHRHARPDAALLGLLNTRYVVAEFAIEHLDLELRAVFSPTHVYENRRVLPRAFVVHRVRAVGDASAVLPALATLDPGREAVVEGDTAQTLDFAAEPEPAEAPHYSPNRIVVQAETSAPGLLVLSEMWYPGWRASDDGQPVRIYRTDGILRGVYLEPGSHRLTFAYRPLSVQVGGAISGLSALALIGCLAWAAIRARRPAP